MKDDGKQRSALDMLKILVAVGILGISAPFIVVWSWGVLGHTDVSIEQKIETVTNMVSNNARSISYVKQELRAKIFDPVPADLADPFNQIGSPMSIDLSRSLTWSIGPDQIDDDGRVIYDPTNGTYSTGDIVGHF